MVLAEGCKLILPLVTELRKAVQKKMIGEPFPALT